MANNLVESIQANLGLPVLQKVDPNIQEAKDKNSTSSDAKLAQAAIPAVAAGIYRLTRTDEGCARVQGSAGSAEWLSTIFEEKTNDVVEKVARYANIPRAETKQLMQKVAAEVIKIIRSEQTGVAGDATALREYMSQQRHNILVYLPAAMQVGDLLNDSSLDDRTNKMEGPVSNLMHKIENVMARGES